MVGEKENLLNVIEEAQVLGVFKKFCENNSSLENIIKLRNIYYLSKNKIKTTIEIIKREQYLELNYNAAERLSNLISAFLKKSNYRDKLDERKKIELLIKQNYRCAICGCNIESKYHADHIVPFKYVGNELENNWQILCPSCNERKRDSIDYQIRYLLKLI